MSMTDKDLIQFKEEKKLQISNQKGKIPLEKLAEDLGSFNSRHTQITNKYTRKQKESLLLLIDKFHSETNKNITSNMLVLF